MKIFPLLLLLLVPFCAFAANASAIDLPAAVAAKQVSVMAVATGGLGSDNLKCTVKNLTGKPISVKVPSGLHFKATDPDRQDLVTTSEQMLALNQSGTSSFMITGFCMEANDMSPATNQAYNFSGYVPGNLRVLSEKLGAAEPIAGMYGQMYVWAITDRRSMYPVSVPKEYIKQAQEITRFVCSVTNLPEVAVTTPEEAALASTKKVFAPTVEVFSNNAFIVFHNPTEQVASFKLYEADGKENYTFYSNRKLTPGVKKYQVGVNHMVPFGSSPVFYLRVMNSAGKVLAEEKITKTTQPKDTEPELLEFVFNCTFTQAIKNARMRVYLTDGTLVGEVSKHAYLPIGNLKMKTKFLHLYPANTTLVAKWRELMGRFMPAKPSGKNKTAKVSGRDNGGFAELF